MARRLLGARWRDLLTPLWRRLAGSEHASVFSPAEPALHRSFLLTRAQDWEAVRECVLQTPQWQQHPSLCIHLAESCFHRRRRTEALAAWCHVCWRAPEEASEAVRGLKQPELTKLWQGFLDADEELAPGDFPAWLLLSEPALGRQLPLDLPPAETPAEEHYRLVHRWLEARRAKRTEEDLGLRKALQASAPVLFRVLLTQAV